MILRALTILLVSNSALYAESAGTGQKLFHLHCAACHGSEARGDGPMAEVLRVSPPDLTRLAQRNGGRLPAQAMAAQIDGTATLPGHGATMPVYGYFFSDGAKHDHVVDGQTVTASRPVVDLITWLQQLQVR